MRLRLLGAKLVITLAGSAQAFSSAAALTPLGLRLRGAGSPLSGYPQASPEVRAVACAKSAGPDGAARFPCRHSGRASGRTVVTMGRKPGVMEPDELKKFVEAAGDKLIVVDARNPDFKVEPGDEGTHAKGGIPGLAGGGGAPRPRAVNAPYDREKSCLDLAKIPTEWIEAGGGKEAVPVITHCGGGGRGQKAMDYLLANGFKNVANGGGPEDDECWAVFGSK